MIMQSRTEDDRTLEASIRLRLPYIEPLNLLQIELMKRHRAGETDPRIAEGIQLTINAIATAWAMGARGIDAVCRARGIDCLQALPPYALGRVEQDASYLSVGIERLRSAGKQLESEGIRYYDASERKRVRDGCDARFDRGFEKITRRDGTYYLRSAFRE